MTISVNDPATLFVQCPVDGLYPEVAQAVDTVFNRIDQPVHIPGEQTCCGQPVFNTGYHTHARGAAKRFIDIFESAKVIVKPSGSCVDMVRNHYPLLFNDDPAWLSRAHGPRKVHLIVIAS